VQPVDTGRSVVGRHDGSDDLLGLWDGFSLDLRYLNVLLSEAPSLLVQALLCLEACPLLLSVRPRGLVVVERPLQADAERVFLVSKLVDKVAGVTPEREVRVGRGSVEGRPGAVLIVVVEEISWILVAGTCWGRERVERDVGRPPVVVRGGRNLDRDEL
jgi:hypothetical protein